MQEVRHNGTKGKVRTADTLEDLLPAIKKSLADPKVKYVKVFNMPDIKKFASKEEVKSFMDGIKEVDKILAED